MVLCGVNEMGHEQKIHIIAGNGLVQNLPQAST